MVQTPDFPSNTNKVLESVEFGTEFLDSHELLVFRGIASYEQEIDKVCEQGIDFYTERIFCRLGKMEIQAVPMFIGFDGFLKQGKTGVLMVLIQGGG